MGVKTISFAVEAGTGKKIETTVTDIIKNRILWEGDSGSGKSHGMVGMIEETDELAQRIIIDPEGEYFPLKDNFTFLLVGKTTEKVKPNVELNLNDVYVDKLVQKLIENSIDAIIDLSEYPGEATHFLNVFQKAIFKYAKLMKRPLLIFVDEAQMFAPEKGQGNEESLKAMMQLAKRGRKRGIGLICGTQAIADFSKNVVRQLRTRFIGNCTYDNDVKAAAHFLGFGKEREPELRELGEEHLFFVSGKGITIGGKKPKQVTKIQANPNKTKLYDFDFNKNIKLKEKDAATMKNLAANFSDIPQLIDEELSEKETLQKDNFEFKKQLQEQKIKIIQLERQQPRQDPQAIETAHTKGYNKAVKDAKIQFDKIIKSHEIFVRQNKVNRQMLKELVTRLQATLDQENGFIKGTDVPVLHLDLKEIGTMPISLASVQRVQSEIKTVNYIAKKPITEGQPVGEEDIGVFKLKNSEAKVLTSILQFPGQRASRKRIALYCGYAVKGGAYGNIIGKLRSSGLIQYEGEFLVATQLGINEITEVPPMPTDSQEIINFWVNKLGPSKGKVLSCIFEYQKITREELAEKTGYTAGGGAFGNILGGLRTLGLIEYLPDKEIGISKELFPELLA